MEEPSPLFRALNAQNSADLQRLLRAGISPDERNSAGLTPLMVAAATRKGAMAAVLISAGANIEARDEAGGTTPLMFAVKAGDFETVSQLIRSGANLNSRDQAGRTALFYAVQQSGRRRRQFVTLLLNSGADTSIPDKSGVTPMKLARRRSCDISIPFLSSTGFTIYWSWPFGATIRDLRR
jgi:ankyrin repeat protein